MPETDPAAAPPPAAFISYCRADSDFALRLAQDLKAAGAVVWIDQLDIAAGQLWDNAIEEALIAAPRMLLILSPASAHSDNVRNEISFALEQGKIIVPVLYRDCTVPLQLQRANRIDFRADYTYGLRTLLAGLHVTHPDAAALREASEAEARRHTAWEAREAEARRLQERNQQNSPEPIQEPLAEPQEHAQPIAQPSPRPPEPSRNIGKFVLIGGLALAAILAVVFVIARPHAAPSDLSPTVSPAAVPAAPGMGSRRRPEPVPASQLIPACVFDPVSNIRTEPNPQSPLACSIDTVRTIQVNPNPIQRPHGLWWETTACGSTGYVAANQVHVNQQCPAATNP